MLPQYQLPHLAEHLLGTIRSVAFPSAPAEKPSSRTEPFLPGTGPLHPRPTAWRPHVDPARGEPAQDTPDLGSHSGLAGGQRWARANVTVSENRQ